MTVSFLGLMVILSSLGRASGFVTRRSLFVGQKSLVSLSASSTEEQADNAPVDTPQPLKQLIRLRGPVDEGYGRGGKQLGFPTANLPSSLFADALQDIPTGVYFGWAVIEGDDETGRNTPQKAVVNVGYSPTFVKKENKEKIVEAHIMLEEDEEKLSDFYNETMRLALSGFLRPEMKFPSFPDLVAAINNDVVVAKEALAVDPYASLVNDPFIADACQQGGNKDEMWIGKDGGDDHASWEFQEMDDALS